jgi:Domain of unknown function (DUF4342)
MPLNKETLFETLQLDPKNVEAVIERLKAVVHEGNVRRLIIKNRDGRNLIEVPLTAGVVGAALLPVWAAIGAIAAIAADCEILIEKRAE